jgi:hypothetical protein
VTRAGHPTRLLPIALCALLVALAATGCARTATSVRSAKQPQRSAAATESPTMAGTPIVSAPPVPQGQSVGERTMPYAKRKATMPAMLPIEIPVIDGSVVSTSAAVSNASWLYTLETTGSIATVADWYARAYANASWRVRDYVPGDDTLRIMFVKHAAQTVLTVRRLSADKVEVRASIGVGQAAPTTN